MKKNKIGLTKFLLALTLPIPVVSTFAINYSTLKKGDTKKKGQEDIKNKDKKKVIRNYLFNNILGDNLMSGRSKDGWKSEYKDSKYRSVPQYYKNKMYEEGLTNAEEASDYYAYLRLMKNNDQDNVFGGFHTANGWDTIFPDKPHGQYGNSHNQGHYAVGQFFMADKEGVNFIDKNSKYFIDDNGTTQFVFSEKHKLDAIKRWIWLEKLIPTTAEEIKNESGIDKNGQTVKRNKYIVNGKLVDKLPVLKKESNHFYYVSDGLGKSTNDQAKKVMITDKVKNNFYRDDNGWKLIVTDEDIDKLLTEQIYPASKEKVDKFTSATDGSEFLVKGLIFRKKDKKSMDLNTINQDDHFKAFLKKVTVNTIPQEHFMNLMNDNAGKYAANPLSVYSSREYNPYKDNNPLIVNYNSNTEYNENVKFSIEQRIEPLISWYKNISPGTSDTEDDIEEPGNRYINILHTFASGNLTMSAMRKSWLDLVTSYNILIANNDTRNYTSFYSPYKVYNNVNSSSASNGYLGDMSREDTIKEYKENWVDLTGSGGRKRNLFASRYGAFGPGMFGTQASGWFASWTWIWQEDGKGGNRIYPSMKQIDWVWEKYKNSNNLPAEKELRIWFDKGNGHIFLNKELAKANGVSK